MTEEKNILKKFERLKAEGLYKVPDSYFNTIAERVQERIAHGKSVKQPIFIFKTKPALAVAFLSLGILYIFFLGLKVLLPIWNANKNNQVRTEEIAIYLDKEAYSIDDAVLATEVYKDAANSVQKTDADDTEEYLLNDDIATNEILNEL